MSSTAETQTAVAVEASVSVMKRPRLSIENVSSRSGTPSTNGTNGTSSPNGAAARPPPLKQRQEEKTFRKEENFNTKVLRPFVPSVSSTYPYPYREGKRWMGVGEEESQYERAVAAVVQSEKLPGERESLPVAENPERAAYLSRLEPSTLSAREEKEFPEVAQGPQALKDLHLELRNRVLQLWLRNPRQHLVVRTVLSSLSTQTELHFDQDHLVKIVKCLNRMCLINFGDFVIERPVPPVRQLKHVIVIGAGLAGLAAARQLRHFGFKVTVVEARNRVGGRVQTWTANGNKTLLGESGAMLVTGVEGNPIQTILNGQLNLKMENFDVRCPIFSSDGTPISQETDDVIEQEFDQLVAAAPAHYRNFCTPNTNCPQALLSTRGQCGRPYGLGTCIKELLELKELEITIQNNIKLKEKVEETKNLNELYVNRIELFHKAKFLLEEFKKLTKNGQKSSANKNKIRLNELKNEIQKNENEIEKKEACPDPALPQKEYFSYISEEGRSLLAWHLANYDFANGIPVEELSVEHWDEEEEEEFVLKGGHYAVPGGLTQMTEKLAAGLCISYNQSVTKIACDTSGVKVTVRFSQNGSLREMAADAVVSTLPLGVLKQSLAEDTIKFEPPLPLEKILAIQRLGFGVLNKVILTYTRKFWKAKRTLFGFANGNLERRGEFFMFWGLYDQPVLIALISGKAAVELEGVSDADIVQSCTEVLQKIFGRGSVTLPKEFSVTRWGTDEFARGSYSSVPVGASGADFDTLAEPIVVEGVPRLCFAGEHTARRYPGTMHGALLSGFREATRIADSFGGTDNVY